MYELGASHSHFIGIKFLSLNHFVHAHFWVHFAGAGSLPCEPLVLLGKLTPDESLDDLYNGEIVFSDGTSSIVCEVSQITLQCTI